MLFPVVMADENFKELDDPIYYIITKNGPMLRKKLDFIDAIIPVKNISILKDVTPKAKINIPKIPEELFCKIVSFFREVYDQYQAEAIVLLYYNKEKSEYFLHIPQQKVTRMSLEYHRGSVFDGYNLVCSIHSHGSLSAFHSGTDTGDEESFDGLHITVGSVEDKDIQIASSIMVNGTRVKTDPIDNIEGITVVKDEEDEEKKYYIMNGVKILYGVKQKNSTLYRLEYIPHDEEWMNNVEGEKYSYVKEVNRGYVFDENTDDEFLEYCYNHYMRDVYGHKALPYVNMGTKDVKENKEDTELTGPCKTCPFNKHIKNRVLSNFSHRNHFIHRKLDGD